MTELKLIPVSDKISLVDTPLGGRFPDSFSILIRGEKTALIDTGCGIENCKRIREQYRPDVVINSHCHPDHICGNAVFAGIDLLVPDIRTDEIGEIAKLARRLVGPDPQVMKYWQAWVRGTLGAGDYTPTGVFRDGEILDFGGVRLQAIHTPGHLDDHFCFFEPDKKILFSFDIDLTGFGPWYGNPECYIENFIQSIKSVMALKPEIIAPSHQAPVTEDCQGELQSFLDKFKRNDQRILRCLDSPSTLTEIVEHKPIYRRYPHREREIYLFFESHMVTKQLERLISLGRVEKQGELFRKT
jgi:glyoxylase-like metal-dependent hydrolase (beta-lactamase superfamily II)